MPDGIAIRGSHLITCASNGSKCSCCSSWGGRAEQVQIGVFQLSTPRFTPLTAKEQQFTLFM